MMNDQAPSAEPTLGELVASLGRDARKLVRQEVQLGVVETKQKATAAATDAALLGAGGALAYAGLLALVAAAVIGLAAALPMWLSALIIGAVLVGIGGGLVLVASRALRRLDVTPRLTVETVKENAFWAKDKERWQ